MCVGVDKMCDVAIIFNLLKQMEKQTTLKDISFDSLYFLIDTIFSELKEMDRFHIKANKVRILKDFKARLPYMLDNTCTCDRIILVFIDAGMLDEKRKLSLIFMLFFWFYDNEKKNLRSGLSASISWLIVMSFQG